MIEPFDLFGPLPSGTTVLEASAGTGKTYAVGALVARYVAEGACRLDEMLIITFGRAASQELRERVREQLVTAARWLSDPADARAQGGLAAHLAGSDDAEAATRRRRLLDALADFDAATIATTHQFCQVVLRSLGVAGDTDPDVQLVEDLDDLLVDVVDDVYLQRYGGMSAPAMSRTAMLALARASFGDPHAEITPSDFPIGSATQERVEVALEIRRHMDDRKQQRGLLSFDDLLDRLARALEAPDSPARERMADRWRIVLVDEFQDTDPVQWEVLQRAFDGPSTLVLIGDPKQAIYAFRGGDIDSYLSAVSASRDRRTLNRNHRSDPALVEALQVLTRGAALGHPAISVLPVDAAATVGRLDGAPVAAPVRLRVVDVEAEDGKSQPSIGALRDHIADDLADDVARLLASGATFTDTAGSRPISAGDVAVLMRSLNRAEPLRRALEDRGIACVVTDRASVLASPAAEEWVRLLEALDRQSVDRVRSVAVTSFFGRQPEHLASDDALTDRVAEQVRDLLDLFRLRGVAAVQEALVHDGLAERVLARPGGERHLTDLEHVGELLHDLAHGRQLGLPALLSWLHEERRDALERAGSSITDRHRRLDTDAAAVQIVTIHSSKGLQYPIVYLPHAFDCWISDTSSQVAMRHHAGGQRSLDVAQPFDPAIVRASRAEDAGEELRLTYVALTRAQSQVVAWWGRSWNSINSGLSRLLLGRGPDEAAVPEALDAIPDMTEALARFSAWEQAGGLTVESSVLERHDLAPVRSDTPDLVTRRLDRPIDAHWRRTSYTGLLRAAEEAGATGASEPEVVGTLDEDVVDDQPSVEPAPVSAGHVASPMSDLPAGAGFGSLVHGVLEHVDPQAPDLESELRDVVTDQLRWWPVDATVDELVAGLLPVHDTPLGPLFGDRTLREIGVGDRLNELDFEIPLDGGDTPRGSDVRLAGVADALRRHLPSGDVLEHYAAHLDGPLADQVLRGYLGGSIDAVMRVDVGSDQRFVVVDYKTNRLGLPEHPVTTGDYTPGSMAASMQHSHYPLQALLYSVVLHRYLRWKLLDYDPDRHLGGIAYLYLRGMAGPGTPMVEGMRCGVFSWRPPSALVVELSQLLAGGGRR